MKSAIINSKIYTGEQIVENKVIVIGNGRVLSLQSEVPDDAKIIDLKGKNIAPGLIDIQVNGGEKYYFSQFPQKKALQDMCDGCRRHGTSYFLPTLISSKHETIMAAIETVKKFKKKNNSVLGLHLEGPIFNPLRSGAHNKEIIRMTTNWELEQIIANGKETIKIITIAPEVFTDAQINLLLNSGIKISIGHSDITYEQAQYYFSKGIHLVTHLYNAMSNFSHRTPGLTGAALENEVIYTPVILDGFHCHYGAARLAYKLKKKKFFLVSDCSFIGRKVNSFRWQGFNIKLENACYCNKEGNLAGSAITMMEAIRNAKENLHCSTQEAIERQRIMLRRQ